MANPTLEQVIRYHNPDPMLSARTPELDIVEEEISRLTKELGEAEKGINGLRINSEQTQEEQLALYDKFSDNVFKFMSLQRERSGLLNIRGSMIFEQNLKFQKKVWFGMGLFLGGVLVAMIYNGSSY